MPDTARLAARTGQPAPLLGLRGVLAGYILVFHVLIFTLGWNLNGSALMPVFFLVSGYGLARAYGGRPINRWRYGRNRIARLAPLYYATLLLAVPPALTGHSWVGPEGLGPVALTNLFAVQMWGGWPPASFVGPSWTISTLVFFYIAFPGLLSWAERRTDAALARWLIALFWVQLVAYFGLSIALDPLDKAWAFWAAHAWPVSRMPVFAMGVVAGLLAARGSRAQIFGRWGAAASDLRAGVYVTMLAAASVSAVLGQETLAHWWMQGLFPLLLLRVIAGLDLAPAQGVTAKALSSRPATALGQIALPLYLVHEVVLYYLAWLAVPDQRFFFAVLPSWTIAVAIPAALVMASLLHRAIERPGSRLLRAG